VSSSRIAGLALLVGLCGLPSRSAGWGYPPRPLKQSRYEELSASAVSALAGRTFEYWADREHPGTGRCDTSEADFRAITPQLKCAVKFSRDGRAIDLTLADDTSGLLPMQGRRDRTDGTAIYFPSTSLLSFRVLIDGSPMKAELTFHGSGLCIVRRTRGTLQPASVHDLSGAQNNSRQ